MPKLPRTKNFNMKYEYDCGPTSVAIWLTAYNVFEYKPGKLIKILGTTEKDGTSLRRINSFLKSLNIFKVEQYTSFSKAQKILKSPTPLLVCWNMQGKFSHYSILLDMDEHEVIILDPYDKPKFTRYNIIKFKKYWSPYKYWFERLIPKKKSKSIRSFIGAGAVAGITGEHETGQLNISKVEEWIREAKK